MKAQNKSNRISFYLILLAGILLAAGMLRFSARQVWADPEEGGEPTPEVGELTPTEELPPSEPPTEAPSPSPTEEAPSVTPEDSPTPTPSLEDSPTPNPTPTPAENETPTPVPSVSQGPSPTEKPSNTPTPTVEATPTPTPYAIVIPPDKETHYKVKATKKAADVCAAPAVTVDGSAEELWDWYPTTAIENAAWGESGASGAFQVIWTRDTLYVLAHVTDSTYDVSSELFSRKDCVEVFLNESGTLPAEYGAGDQHYRVSRKGEIKCGSGGDEAGFRAAVSETEDGYLVEMAIPFQTIQAAAGTVIGFDIRVNDSQGQGNRDYMIQWSDTSMQTHVDLSAIGTITLQ